MNNSDQFNFEPVFDEALKIDLASDDVSVRYKALLFKSNLSSLKDQRNKNHLHEALAKYEEHERKNS